MQECSTRPPKVCNDCDIAGSSSRNRGLVQPRQSLGCPADKRQTFGKQTEKKRFEELRPGHRSRDNSGAHARDPGGNLAPMRGGPTRKYIAVGEPHGETVFGGNRYHFARERRNASRIPRKKSNCRRMPKRIDERVSVLEFAGMADRPIRRLFAT